MQLPTVLNGNANAAEGQTTKIFETALNKLSVFSVTPDTYNALNKQTKLYYYAYVAKLSSHCFEPVKHVMPM